MKGPLCSLRVGELSERTLCYCVLEVYFMEFFCLVSFVKY